MQGMVGVGQNGRKDRCLYACIYGQVDVWLDKEEKRGLQLAVRTRTNVSTEST